MAHRGEVNALASRGNRRARPSNLGLVACSTNKPIACSPGYKLSEAGVFLHRGSIDCHWKEPPPVHTWDPSSIVHQCEAKLASREGGPADPP